MAESDADRCKEIVRAGYDSVSERYRGDDGSRGIGCYDYYGDWLPAFAARLGSGARALDLGCGNGIPATRYLVAAGCRVTGIDFSEVQIARARALVPGAELRCADITEIDFPPDRHVARARRLVADDRG